MWELRFFSGQANDVHDDYDDIHHSNRKGDQMTTTPANVTPAPELLPCPFCGGDDLFIANGPPENDWCAVKCISCDTTGPTDYSDPHAIVLWNRRAGQDA